VANTALEENCARILHLAEHLYAAHISLHQIMNLIEAESARSHLVAVIERSTKEVISLGGKVRTQHGSLGIQFPIVTNVDGEEIDYYVGRKESEKFLNNLRQIM